MASADGNSNNASAPGPCAKGCGFFGNPNTQGMCSKCYKETLASATGVAPPAAMSVLHSPKPEEAAASSASASSPASASAAPPACQPCVKEPAAAPSAAFVEDSKAQKQVNTSRCWSCNKKIGLLGFKCKCDFFFCSEHRYSDKHECSFDYKAQGKQLLTQANPAISPAKLQGF